MNTIPDIENRHKHSSPVGFKATLGQLCYRSVQKVLRRRADLVSSVDSGGDVITNEYPTEFASRWSRLGTGEQLSVKAEYSYFCGFADGVHFSKTAWDTRQRVRFMPAVMPEPRFGMPIVGDMIFGQIDDTDPKNQRFLWWNICTKAEERFAGLVLGNIEVSRGTLEKKLTVLGDGKPVRDLYVLALALRYRDAALLAEMTLRGETAGDRYLPVSDWLEEQLLDIDPEICAEVRELVQASA